jgi:hypothetical protein
VRNFIEGFSKVLTYHNKKPKKEEKSSYSMGKIRGKISFQRIKKGGEKFP